MNLCADQREGVREAQDGTKCHDIFRQVQAARIAFMSTGRSWGVAYAGFLLNGMAVVLLGPLLPRLQATWRLGDGQGGALLASQFLGMTVGTIFVLGERRRALRLGAACAWAGLSGLAGLIATGAAGVPVEVAACGALLLYGFGLGQAITALNLNLGDREGRASRLSFGNAMWSVGAILGPLLLAVALRDKSLTAWLLGVALLFPAIWLWNPGESEVAWDDETGAGLERGAGLSTVLVFAALMFLYGSAEACFSGWVTTFARREGGVGVMVSPLTVSAFWFGVAGGRGSAGVVLRGWRERDALLLVLGGAVAASVGLVFANGIVQISVWVALAGLMVGPGFPLILAEVLNRRASTRETGTVLAMCGLGATVMPLLFGVVSQRTSSLREALLLPGACLLGMLILGAFGVRSAKDSGDARQALD